MTKRRAVSAAYFFVVLMTLLLRVSGAIGIYDKVSVSPDVYFTLTVQLLCFGILPAALYFLLYKKQAVDIKDSFSSDFRLKNTSFRNYVRAAIIGACMIFMATVISYVWQLLLNAAGFRRASSAVDLSTPELLLLELCMTALLPGVFEEFTHRGLLFAGYRDSGIKVVLVSALLFALMHQNITQTLYTFFDGLILALLVYYTRSIYPAIMVHIFNNAVSVLSQYASQNGGFFSFMNVASDWLFGSIVGFLVNMLIFFIVGCIMVFLFKRMRDDAVNKGIVPSNLLERPAASALPLRRDIFFIATVSVGAAATLFSLVWGMI